VPVLAREVHRGWLDAEVVCAPVDDALFDGFGFEALGDGFVDEGGKLFVGGEAEGDELALSELGDEVGVGWREEGSEAETLFEADDAVLGFEGAAAGDAGDEDEYEGHDDPPQMGVAIRWPGVDGGVDGKAEIDEEQRHHGEVEERLETGVVLVVLGCGHGFPFQRREEGGIADGAMIHGMSWRDGKMQKWA
jgi:hypothetical protein